MPSADREQAMVLRQFSGISLSVDPAFLPPDKLQLAQNWIPDQQTYLLTKRRGTAPYQTLSGSTARVPLLVRVYDTAGNRYLYAVEDRAVGTDRLQVSTNDGAFATIASAFLSTDQALYGAAVLGNRVYFGNGVDFIKFVDLSAPTTAVDINPIGAANDTGQTATPAAEATSRLIGGTYAYRWGLYDHTLKVWTKMGNAPAALTYNTVQVTSGQKVTFLAPQVAGPATTPGANEKWHLLVAPANFPIELAYDQTPEGLAPATTVAVTDLVITAGLEMPLPTVTRTGKFLVAHRNRIWLAGDNSGNNASRVFATSILLPGLEQAAFNRGDFFPANALLNVNPGDGDFITGIAPLLASTQAVDPRAPLAIFKNRSTWLWYGDILDDDTAQLVNLSNFIGCIAHATIQATPIGLIFCGHDSVYLLPPGGEGPQDIGQDIWPEIRAIPRDRRAAALATYHKGFYKLAYTGAGGTQNTKQLWLDCRRFSGTPSWWGPHLCAPISAAAVAQRDVAEDDRGFAAIEASGVVVLHEQAGSYADNGVTNAHRLRTAVIDGGRPFERKTFTRIRVNGQGAAPTSLTCQATVDSGVTTLLPDLVLAGQSAGAQWDTSEWETAQWGVPFFEEADSRFPATRGRGRSAEILLVNTDGLRIDLRDFELTYLPVDRPVGPATVTTSY